MTTDLARGGRAIPFEIAASLTPVVLVAMCSPLLLDAEVFHLFIVEDSKASRTQL
jgi:hypothetical protein